MRSFGWALVHHGWCPSKMRKCGRTHAARDRVTTAGEDGPLETEGQGPRSQPRGRPALASGLQSPGETHALFKPPRPPRPAMCCGTNRYPRSARCSVTRDLSKYVYARCMAGHPGERSPYTRGT